MDNVKLNGWVWELYVEGQFMGAFDTPTSANNIIEKYYKTAKRVIKPVPVFKVIK